MDIRLWKFINKNEMGGWAGVHRSTFERHYFYFLKHLCKIDVMSIYIDLKHIYTKQMIFPLN